MTKKQETLKAAEQLVRDVLKDFGQRVDRKTLHEVAMRVARAVPVQSERAKSTKVKETVAA
jgi:GTP cyclohydrolase I